MAPSLRFFTFKIKFLRQGPITRAVPLRTTFHVSRKRTRSRGIPHHVRYPTPPLLRCVSRFSRIFSSSFAVFSLRPAWCPPPLPPPFCAFNFPRLPFLVFVFDPFRSRSPALLSRRTRASSSSPRRCPHRADEQTRRLHRNAHRRGYVHYSSRMGVGSHRSSCSAASFPSSSATFALSSFIHSLSSKFSLFFYSTRGGSFCFGFPQQLEPVLPNSAPILAGRARAAAAAAAAATRPNHRLPGEFASSRAVKFFLLFCRSPSFFGANERLLGA